MIKIFKYVCLTVSLASLGQRCFALSNEAENTIIGRYITVANKPSRAQLNLLSQIIQIRFPQHVQTVGEAVTYVLRYSGYSLIAPQKMNSALKNTLSKTLPAIDRNLEPMTLADALTVLIGSAFTLVYDPLNRTVDFHVKPQFRHLSNPK